MKLINNNEIFYVIDLPTTLSRIKNDSKPENLTHSREYVKDRIRIERYDIDPLFDQLIKKGEAGLVDSQVILGSRGILGQEKRTF